MGFRENLKKQRLAAGFSSARKFAKAVGIPYARYINYEGPKGIEPSFAELNHIARFLHVTTDTLLDDTDNENSLVDYARAALFSTPFEIVSVNDAKVRIGIRHTDTAFDFDKESFLKSVKDEVDYSRSAMSQVLVTRMVLYLKIYFYNHSDLTLPEVRDALMETNFFDISMSDLILPSRKHR